MRVLVHTKKGMGVLSKMCNIIRVHEIAVEECYQRFERDERVSVDTP